jgi:hypothetical protein
MARNNHQVSFILLKKTGEGTYEAFVKQDGFEFGDRNGHVLYLFNFWVGCEDYGIEVGVALCQSEASENLLPILLKLQYLHNRQHRKINQTAERGH